MNIGMPVRIWESTPSRVEESPSEEPVPLETVPESVPVGT